MGAHEDVHAVDLQQAEPIDRPSQLRRADVAMPAQGIEALCRQRDATGLGK
jgi:hypothetical protein